MSITGCASHEGTLKFAKRFGDAAAGHFRDAQGLTLSSVGIGTYLGNPDEQTDRAYGDAVIRTVERGANVIDTAANYRFQRSERSIGAALRDLTAQGFSREELVICTKGVYLPFDGEPPRNVRQYVQETFVDPGVTAFDDIVAGSHCMTPAYLQNQLDQSLRNMQIDCVDVYYIHNPESQLGHVSDEEFYFRIRNAFDALERNRREGKVQFYGVATWNGFRAAAGSAGYHSLAKMVSTAREAGGEDHGFRFIQLPFNLAMPEALTILNHDVEGQRVTLLEAARALGITVIASASIFQGRVAQGLPDNIRQVFGSLETDAQTAIQFVRSTPGITTALVGMSSTDHVEQNLALANVEPATSEQYMQLFSSD